MKTLNIMLLLSGPVAGHLPVVDMIYESKKMEAFFLGTWLTEGGMLRTILRIRSCFKRTMHALGEGGWAQSQFEDCRYIVHYYQNCKNILHVTLGWKICGLKCANLRVKLRN